MPLSFSTAGRASGEEPADAAVPAPDDRERWRRPYRPGPWRVGIAAVLLLLASYVMAAAVIIMFAGTAGEAAWCTTLAVAIIAAALRLLRCGVWVSARGLRRTAFFVTRTRGWREVGAVRTQQQPVRWLGLPRTVQGQALMLHRPGRANRAGTPPLALLTTHDADFLGREELFDRASDTVEAWAEEYGALR